MAPSAPVSRKAKRKTERDEKKRSRNKRQRRTDDVVPALVPAAALRSKPTNKQQQQRDGTNNHSTNNRKRPHGAAAASGNARNGGIQNKFHELLQETTGLSMTRGKAALSREDAEIKALETKLGLSSSKGTGLNKLKKEFTKDGLGEDFVDFLQDLDKISAVVKERQPTARRNAHDDVASDADFASDADEDASGSDDDASDASDDAFGSDLEMDDETRKELALLQAEDAEFLQGMDELPTDESDLEDDEDVDLATFDTDDDNDEEDDNEEDDVAANTRRNQQTAAAASDDSNREESEESDEDDDDEGAGSDNAAESDDAAASAADLVVTEDIYGRPVIKTAAGATPSAYIPPHLRRKLQDEAAAASSTTPTVRPTQMDDQAMRELARRLNGQLNRISEANMESIALEIEKIYRAFPRSVVNSVLLDKILSTACHPGIVMTPMIKVSGALIAALYHSVGSEVGGFFVEKLVLKLVASVQHVIADSHAEDVLEDDTNDASTSKEPVNLLLLIAMLYNFGVVQCTLIYDLFRSFVDSFAPIEVELLHQLLQVSGHQLRSDDADALRDMVASVQHKAAALTEAAGGAQPAERVRFILDLIYDLKKPGKKKNSGRGDDLAPLRKWIGRVKTRVGNGNNPLRLSLHELLHADKDGRWWIVGGTWVGYQPTATAASNRTGSISNTMSSDAAATTKQRDDESRLLQLAEKQRMNTDVRRRIFVAIMGATDCIDATERLLQLHLKAKQEREIVRVLLHCAGQEPKANPFYRVLATKLCESDARYKFTFQLAFWDAFKQLETIAPRKLYNTATLLAGLVIDKALSLSVLKVLDFTDLSQATVLFLRVVLETILKLETDADVAQVFDRLLQTKKAQVTIDGLAVFVHQHLTSFKTEDDLAVRALLKRRSKNVKSLLDHLSKSAAAATAQDDMASFM